MPTRGRIRSKGLLNVAWEASSVRNPSSFDTRILCLARGICDVGGLQLGGDPEDAEHVSEERTLSIVLMELCGVTVFFAQAAITTKKLYDHLLSDDIGSSSVLYLYIALAIFVGILAADIVSGIVHWAADNWGSSSWPGIGPAFIWPFRHHHIDPRSITRHGFLELNGNNLIVSIPLLRIASSALGSQDRLSALTAASFWLSFALFCGYTNQFHCWAHMEQPPALVRGLQNVGLLMSRQHHHLHHIRPHDCYYCITTGWMNRPLTALGFFPALEKAITTVTGAIPLHQQLKKS
ncbi:hypothetical protein BBK36DRAFT_23835 [Trichoderma citrinoviride]|uniref:Lipid desaturase domain-containing protein n=1 Tax=Trichoderma citrinoviride TaxID=58853 RepID=A0A2T4AYX8_9HYPO|nr:hypothetical protein BBK36DRAFT_23835 [Trichoderma citrinoviride]PTB62275.1 hypothetical protein BBK36DRAFT_23835 [Trichoderma citrinoviride]